MGSGDEHLVCHSPGLSGNDAKPHSWEDEHVVTLPNGDRLSTVRYLGERAASGNQGAPICPDNQVCRSSLALGGWVGKREDNWPFNVPGHLAHDGFRENSCPGRRTDQDRRVYLRHHLLQPNLLWRRYVPSSDTLLRLCIRHFLCLQVAAPGMHETVAINQPDRSPRLF